MRALLLVLGLCSAAAARPDGTMHTQNVAHIIAVIEAREKATGAFCAAYYETDTRMGNRRVGPRFFAWSPDRSLYRGPKRGPALPVLGWLTEDEVERESIYFRDRTRSVWLQRETEPVALPWNGTRDSSSGPDLRWETRFFWRDCPISEYLRDRTVTILGHEPVAGDPCVKLLVHERTGRDPWPQTKQIRAMLKAGRPWEEPDV